MSIAEIAPISLSRRWKWASRQAISFLMAQAVENADCISLAAGLVDQQTLPVSAVRAACAHLLGQETLARAALQYGTTAGAERLRRLLLGHLASLEGCPVEQLGVDLDQVVVTTGSQQLLSLVGEILVDPEDIVLVSAPTYFAYLGTLHGLGARVVPVPADDQGLNTALLEAQLNRIEQQGALHRVKLIYAVSFYENPTGVSLAQERRGALVELARRYSKHHRIFVLEDAAYRELHYDGPEYSSLFSQDPSRETVILAQTFSKTLSPGLRVGYGVLPKALVKPVCDRKGNEDFGSANFNQHVLATIFEQGYYEPHVSALRAAYRAKRDCLLAAIDRHFADLRGVRWVRPHGGLYVWMTLPEHVQTGFDSRLFRRATEVEKVMYVPGELCYAGSAEQRRANQMRLSFGTQNALGLEQGIERLARAVRAVLR
jgi:2-aminoadipate transaminase